jgi:hypothetical protein
MKYSHNGRKFTETSPQNNNFVKIDSEEDAANSSATEKRDYSQYKISQEENDLSDREWQDSDDNKGKKPSL